MHRETPPSKLWDTLRCFYEENARESDEVMENEVGHEPQDFLGEMGWLVEYGD